MTGYGRGECARNGFKIAVELSSVNRKQSEITVYLPRELEPLEAQARAELNKRIARGRVTVKVGLRVFVIVQVLLWPAVKLTVPSAAQSPEIAGVK